MEASEGTITSKRSHEVFDPGLLDAMPHWQGPVDGLIRVAVTTSRSSKQEGSHAEPENPES